MLALHHNATSWVPGHGALMHRDSVLSQARLLDRVATVVTSCWHARESIARAADAVPLGGENAQRAVTRGYRELDARFRELDGAEQPETGRRQPGPTTLITTPRRS
jgi:hypothetical protein